MAYSVTVLGWLFWLATERARRAYLCWLLMVSKKFPFGHVIYFCWPSLFGQDGWVLVDLDLFKALLLTSTSSQSTKMQNKKNLANIHLAWSSMTSASKLRGGRGGGGRKPPSVPLLHPILELVRRQVSQEGSFPWLFSTFIVLNKYTLYVYTLPFSVKENVQHIVK